MEQIRKTKIVCTMGPACTDEKILGDMMMNGMNVARLNFSHGDHEEHMGRVNLIRKVSAKLGKTIALLLDTKGPEIRTGEFEEGTVFEAGTDVVLRYDDVVGNTKEFSCTYKSMHEDLKPGNSILIDDGLVELQVKEVVDKDVHCVVVNSGKVSTKKSINLPGVSVNLPALTERDIRDVEFAVKNNFDFIAASFIRKASDVVEIKRILEGFGGSNIQVISKIENAEGVENFEEILAVSDGIMVARGDLGVEVPVYTVPSAQKHMIRATREAGKPCITATQMLDSMIRNPRPTRAEVSDVANAIMDGTAAIMLSGETASGKYSALAVKMMNDIALYTESKIDYWKRFLHENNHKEPTTTDAICHATCTTARDLGAKAILTVTHKGTTARSISRFRPACPIYALTHDEQVMRQLQLAWGVTCYLKDQMLTIDEHFKGCVDKALEKGAVAKDDLVVITAGMPFGVSGSTNTIKVETV